MVCFRYVIVNTLYKVIKSIIIIIIIIISVVVVAVLKIPGGRGKESTFLVKVTPKDVEISTAEQARNLFIRIWGQLQTNATP